MSEPDRVLVEILVAAPIDSVWKTLREPAELKRWFGWEYKGLDDEIAYIVGKVKASDADHVLDTGMGDRFALEAVGTDRTIVRVIRSAPVTDKSWKGIYDDILEGWLTFTYQLRYMLERHSGDARRTLYLNGRAQAAGVALPVQALGLDQTLIVPVNERYSATTAVGDKIDGAVLYRSTYQLGLTVDGYGDGLIIVAARPVTDKSPHGGGSVVITTYGFDDGKFAAMRDRWSRWWRDQYEVIEIQPEQ